MDADSKIFRKYLDRPKIVPGFVWWILRFAALAGVGAVIYLLRVEPDIGLELFWGLLIPALPLVWVVMPGLWRQICPMALLNQLPRTLRFSASLTLPTPLRRGAFIIASIVFVGFIALRPLSFNNNAETTSLLIIGALGFAFLGGLIIKGRAGWCGTFCPLAPIQRIYGHAPLMLFRNGYCPTCVGCQKNCYDFNPRPALLSDLSDPNVHFASQRLLFAGFLPGLLIGFYDPAVTALAQSGDLWAYLRAFAVFPLITTSLACLIYFIFSLSAYKVVLGFVSLALCVFYFNAAPIMLDNAFNTLPRALLALDLLPSATLDVGSAPPPVDPRLVTIFQIVAIVMLIFYLLIGLGTLRAFRESIQSTSINVSRPDQMDLGEQAERFGLRVLEGDSRTELGVVDEKESLLVALERAGIPIESGCRKGLCGADIIGVSKGAENLNEITGDEKETLLSLGLLGKARLACQTCVSGFAVVHVNAENGKEYPVDWSQVRTPSKIAEEDPIQSRTVIIVGNGVAGMSVASRLREESAFSEIIIVSREDMPFYNRIAIPRLLERGKSPAPLVLRSLEWYKRKNIRLMSSTRVSQIDVDAREVTLMQKGTLSYDFLVLATGAVPRIPDVEGNLLSGVFALRTVEDALEVQDWIRRSNVQRVVVVGAGVQGVEVAKILCDAGLDVALLHNHSWPCNRFLDERGGQIVAQFMRDSGARLFVDTKLRRIIGASAVKSVELQSGQVIGADMVILNTGITPLTELARRSGIGNSPSGILVDRNMQVQGARGVYAVGDCADYGDQSNGVWVRSKRMGEIAAESILKTGKIGADSGSPIDENKIELDELSANLHYGLNFTGLHAMSIGTLTPEQGDEVVTRESIEGMKWWRVILTPDGYLRGGICVNLPEMAGLLLEAAKFRVDLRGVLPRTSKDDEDSGESMVDDIMASVPPSTNEQAAPAP